MMDETRWERVAALFDELLVAPDPETILSAESDEEIRLTARDLLEQHQKASSEAFLAEPISFTVEPMFQNGDRLINRFRIESFLGAGGMGEVYRAFDERIQETVAIKTIARLLANSPVIRRRIEAEVKNAHRVAHPNVSRIHDIFDDGETVFFSMQLICSGPRMDRSSPNTPSGISVPLPHCVPMRRLG
jgi:serine/threonine protein kinase